MQYSKNLLRGSAVMLFTCYLILLRFIIIDLPVASTEIRFACWQAHKRRVRAPGTGTERALALGRAPGLPHQTWGCSGGFRCYSCNAKRCVVCTDTCSVLIARGTEVFVIFESTKQGRESWLGFPCASQSARGLCTCLWVSWYAGRSLVVQLCIKSGTSVWAKVPHGCKQLLH